MKIPYCFYIACTFFFIFGKKLYVLSISNIKNIFPGKKLFFDKFGNAIVYLWANELSNAILILPSRQLHVQS